MKKIRSLFTLGYYVDAFKKGTGIKNWLAILLIASLNILVPSFFIISRGYPIAKNILVKVRETVSAVYPDELEIDLTDGHVSTNVTEPYFVTISPQMFSSLTTLFNTPAPTQGIQERILTIDTHASSEDLPRYQSMALLTDSSLIYYSDEDIKIAPLNNAGNMHISESWLMDRIDQYLGNPWVQRLLLIGIFVSPLLVFIFSFLIQIFGLLILSISGYIMARIYNLHSPFSRIFHTLVAIFFTVSLLLDPLTYIPVISKYNPPALSTFLILSLFYLVIRKVNKHAKA